MNMKSLFESKPRLPIYPSRFFIYFLLPMPLVLERTSSSSVRSSPLDLSTGRRWQPQTGRPTATPARRHMATCNLTWLRFPYKISPSGPHMLGFGPLLSSWNIPPAPCALFLPPRTHDRPSSHSAAIYVGDGICPSYEARPTAILIKRR